MPWTIAAIDPDTRLRTVLAEIHGEIAEPTPRLLRDLRRRMYDRVIDTGLFLTPRLTTVTQRRVLNGPFREDDFTRADLGTGELFRDAELGAPKAGEAFLLQARSWIETIASSWPSFLGDTAKRVLVPWVVGTLSKADRFETWDDVLDVEDASAP